MREPIRRDPIARDPGPPELVLWGAGHAHVEVLRQLARRPERGVRVTLISREPHSPYSGMLPGLIRGDYDFDEAHIDLGPLAAAAGARLIIAEATGLDLVARAVTFPDRPPIPFDVLSINIGGEPVTPDDSGVPVKPIGRLLARLAEIEPALQPDTRLAIVGAGAGGTELALALAHRLDRRVGIALVCADTLPLPTAPARARAIARDALVDAGVEILSGVRAGTFHDGRLSLSDGSYLEAAAVLWATGVAISPALQAAGLACDAAGAVRVDRGLRSMTHPFVFAAGDCATIEGAPRPKSGVWSVRAGPVLAGNLRRALRGKDPKPWRPQREALAILGLGNGRAVGWRNGFVHQGGRLWRWKDRIDRRWVARYRVSPLGSPPLAPDGRGGTPVSIPTPFDEDVLTFILGGLRQRGGVDGSDGTRGLELPPAGYAVLHHIDYVPSCLDDPFQFGLIAATQALSGLAITGAHPWMATALVTRAGARDADLTAMLYGANHVLAMAGCSLVGARAVAGATPALGFAVVGLAEPDATIWVGGPRAGDAVVLTRPLGGALILDGARRGAAKARWRQAAIAAMRRSNIEAMAILRTHGACAGVDVMGRGLLGSLAVMLRGTALTARLDHAAIPVLSGARDLLNLESQEEATAFLLAAPEISGGLLAVVPAGLAESCRDELRRVGHAAAIIGAIAADDPP